MTRSLWTLHSLDIEAGFSSRRGCEQEDDECEANDRNESTKPDRHAHSDGGCPDYAPNDCEGVDSNPFPLSYVHLGQHFEVQAGRHLPEDHAEPCRLRLRPKSGVGKRIGDDDELGYLVRVLGRISSVLTEVICGLQHC